MMPTTWDGNKWSNGKPNAVTLVATVLTRKSAVQPSSRFPASSPNMTTNPEKIPTRLNTTCTKVNVDVVIPKIMMRVPPEPVRCYYAAADVALPVDTDVPLALP